MEVVVMLLACHFITSGIAGKLDRLQPFLLHQSLNVAIDGGDTQLAMVALRGFQSLIHR